MSESHEEHDGSRPEEKSGETVNLLRASLDVRAFRAFVVLALLASWVATGFAASFAVDWAKQEMAPKPMAMLSVPPPAPPPPPPPAPPPPPRTEYRPAPGYDATIPGALPRFEISDQSRACQAEAKGQPKRKGKRAKAVGKCRKETSKRMKPHNKELARLKRAIGKERNRLEKTWRKTRPKKAKLARIAEGLAHLTKEMAWWKGTVRPPPVAVTVQDPAPQPASALPPQTGPSPLPMSQPPAFSTIYNSAAHWKMDCSTGGATPGLLSVFLVLLAARGAVGGAVVLHAAPIILVALAIAGIYLAWHILWLCLTAVVIGFWWSAYGVAAGAWYGGYYYGTGASHFFIEIAPYVVLGGAAVCSAAVVFFYLRSLLRRMALFPYADSPSGDEPAVAQYFFRLAAFDQQWVVRDSFAQVKQLAIVVGKLGFRLFRNRFWYLWPLSWPLGAVTWAILAPAALAGLIVYGVSVAAHFMLVWVIITLSAGMALLLRAAEALSMLWRKIFLVCPNSGCHQRIALPHYACGACGAMHTRLVPGRYGVLWRRCRCSALLPTLFLTGRHRLTSFCPHETCGRPLPTLGRQRAIHLALIGAQSAGKSSFLAAGVLTLRRRLASAGGVLAAHDDQGRTEAFLQTLEQRFVAGTAMDKTAELSPDAVVLRAGSKSGPGVLLYVYDPAGELFASKEAVGRQGYLRHLHGIVLLVDPLSLPMVRQALGESLLEGLEGLRPAEEHVDDVYSRVIGGLREVAVDAKVGIRHVPVAVVVTKTDAFGLAEAIDGWPLGPPTGKAPGGEDELQAQRVRAWLSARGGGNLVRSIESDFKHYRYFAVSALGRTPSASGGEFLPRGLLPVWQWLLEQNSVRIIEQEKIRSID